MRFLLFAALVTSLAQAAPVAGEMRDTSRGVSVEARPLEKCVSRHATGFFRDGYCRTDASDSGRHVVCAEVTQAFLDFTKARGNDLVTPSGSFPGLKAGDGWCLCAARWREAVDAGVVLPVRTGATERSALGVATKDELLQGRAARTR